MSKFKVNDRVKCVTKKYGHGNGKLNIGSYYIIKDIKLDNICFDNISDYFYQSDNFIHEKYCYKFNKGDRVTYIGDSNLHLIKGKNYDVINNVTVDHKHTVGVNIEYVELIDYNNCKYPVITSSLTSVETLEIDTIKYILRGLIILTLFEISDIITSFNFSSVATIMIIVGLMLVGFSNLGKVYEYNTTKLIKSLDYDRIDFFVYFCFIFRTLAELFIVVGS